MKFLSYFQSFGFTRNEIKVILLLSCTFLAGLAIRYYNSSRLASNPPEKDFDYSIPDSVFHSLSQKSVDAQAEGMTSGDSIRGRPSLTRSSNAEKIGLAVNINTATKAELMRLPGIGAVYAERIVAYRNDHGPFTSVDGLAKVSGIGKKRLERLRPFLRIQ